MMTSSKPGSTTRRMTRVGKAAAYSRAALRKKVAAVLA
jgi:hypothetical protein